MNRRLLTPSADDDPLFVVLSDPVGVPPVMPQIVPHSGRPTSTSHAIAVDRYRHAVAGYVLGGDDAPQAVQAQGVRTRFADHRSRIFADHRSRILVVGAGLRGCVMRAIVR
jgi:hypothetical protein